MGYEGEPKKCPACMDWEAGYALMPCPVHSREKKAEDIDLMDGVIF